MSDTEDTEVPNEEVVTDSVEVGPDNDEGSSPSIPREWSTNQGYRHWASNPLAGKKAQVPKLDMNDSGEFGELIDPSSVTRTKKHLSKPLITPRGSSFGELLDPDLIVETVNLPETLNEEGEEEDPATNIATAEDEEDLSPLVDVTSLLKAEQELDQMGDADDVADVFDDDLAAVGEIEAFDDEDVDINDVAGIMSPRK